MGIFTAIGVFATLKTLWGWGSEPVQEERMTFLEGALVTLILVGSGSAIYLMAQQIFSAAA